MLKWIAIIFVIVLVIFSLSLVFIRKIGDIRPAILPSTPHSNKSSSTQEIVSLPNNINGEQLPFELQVHPNFQIIQISKNLGKVRDLQMTPNGFLIASKLANPGQVLAITDANGVMNPPKILVDNLNNPHGLAFYKDKLFVAEVDKVSRYNFDEKNLTASFDKKLFDLPAGGAGHITRSLAFDDAGRLFVSIGSTCNVCLEKDAKNGSVIVSDADGNNPQIYSKGLRNAVFIKKDPDSNNIWVTENSRDLLGDNIPPDEINILSENGDFGWPFCYGNKTLDTSFDKNYKNCQQTVDPVFNIQAHSAPLGLAFIPEKFSKDMAGDLLVAYHGSWNRSTPTGYKIVRLTRDGNKITGQEDFITGFLDGSNAVGRPVDLEFSPDGTLFISDDKFGAIYAVTPK